MSGSMVYVNVQNIRTQSLADSGADVSCVSKDVVNRLVPQIAKPYPKSPYHRMSGFCGESHSVLGCVELELRIGTFKCRHKFHVLEKLQYPMLLGKDFFSLQKVILNFADNTLVFSETDKPAVKIEKPRDTLHLRCKKDVEIPPNHIALVQVHVPLHCKNQTLLVENTKTVSRLGLRTETSLICTEMEHIPVWL